MSETVRHAVGYVLLAAMGLGYELALVGLVRRPLVLTWPLALIGGWLNKRADWKSLRIMHGALYRCAPELCTPECWE